MHQTDLMQEAESHRRALQARPVHGLRYSLAIEMRWRLGKLLVGAGRWLLTQSDSQR